MGRKVIKGLTVEVDGDSSKLTKALNDTASKMRSFQRSMNTLNKSIKLDPKNAELYTQKQEVLNKTIKETQSTLEKLEDFKKQLDDKNVEKTNEEYQKTINLISECKHNLEKYKDEVNALPGSWQAFNAQLDMTSDKLMSLSRSTAGMSRAFTVIGTEILKQSLSYETSIANINKVIKDLNDETIDNLKEIAVETGTAFNDISEYATLGATLGIAQKDIASFTKAMVDLQTATNGAIGGEEGAKSVARFLNVLGIGTGQAENFGSALTFVGDQFAATADEILNVASQMAGISQIAKVNENDLIGLSAEMKNLGVKTSSGASAITRTFLKMSQAVELNNGDLYEFADASNMSVEAFKELYESNSMEAFLKFVDGLANSGADDMLLKIANAIAILGEEASDEEIEGLTGKIEDFADGGNSAAIILDNLGLSGVRTAETLLKLAGNSDEVRSAIEDSSKAWRDNTSLVDKANTIYDTTQSKLNGAFEALKQSGAYLGEVASPVIKDVAELIKELAQWVEGLDENERKLLLSTIAFLAMFSKGTKTLALTIKSFSILSDYVGKLIAKIGLASKATSLFGSASTSLLSILGSPSTGLIAGIALVTTACALLAPKIKEVDDNTKKYREDVKELTDSASKQFLNSLVDINNEYEKSNETINPLIDKIKSLNEKINSGDYKDKKKDIEELNEKLEEYNQVVGGQTGVLFHFDEESGKILNQKGEIQDLRKAWEDLNTEKQRQAWLDANRELYNTSSERVDELIKEIAERRGIINDTISKLVDEGYSERDLNDLVLYSQGLIEINDSIKELISKSSSSDKLGSLVISGKKLNQLKEYYDEAKNIVTTFNSVENAKIEEVRKLLDRLNLGLNFNTDDLEEARTKLDEINTLIKNANDSGIVNPEDILKLVEIREELETTISEMEEELNGAKDSLYEDSTKKVSTLGEHLYDALTGALIGFDAELAKERSIDVKVNFRVNEGGELIGGGFYDSLNGYSSGGFGDSINKLTESISRTLNNASKFKTSALKSGGFASGGSANVNITVNNNGADISVSTVRGWARIINEELGKQYV